MNFNVDLQNLMSLFSQGVIIQVWFFAGANQYIENREKKKPLEVAKPQVARAILER